MQLDNMPHIEGLDEFTDHDMEGVEDTHPDARFIHFEVVKEYMPALSEEAGHRVYKNFVHRFYEMELGHSSGSRRIKDKVYYDESKGWRVEKLASAGQSDIKKFPHEWNRFVKGNNSVIEGTPIEFLFKNDPSRADMFAKSSISTIERLALLSDADCEGRMGWRDDRSRAQTYLNKVKEASGSIANSEYVKRLEADLAAKTDEINDLKAKFDAFLTSQIEARQDLTPKLEAPKAGKAKKKQPAEDSDVKIEGM